MQKMTYPDGAIVEVEADDGRSESFISFGPSRHFLMDYGFEIRA